MGESGKEKEIGIVKLYGYLRGNFRCDVYVNTAYSISPKSSPSEGVKAC